MERSHAPALVLPVLRAGYAGEHVLVRVLRWSLVLMHSSFRGWLPQGFPPVKAQADPHDAWTSKASAEARNTRHFDYVNHHLLHTGTVHASAGLAETGTTHGQPENSDGAEVTGRDDELPSPSCRRSTQTVVRHVLQTVLERAQEHHPERMPSTPSPSAGNSGEFPACIRAMPAEGRFIYVTSFMSF